MIVPICKNLTLEELSIVSMVLNVPEIYDGGKDKILDFTSADKEKVDKTITSLAGKKVLALSKNNINIDKTLITKLV